MASAEQITSPPVEIPNGVLGERDNLMKEKFVNKAKPTGQSSEVNQTDYDNKQIVNSS